MEAQRGYPDLFMVHCLDNDFDNLRKALLRKKENNDTKGDSAGSTGEKAKQ